MPRKRQKDPLQRAREDLVNMLRSMHQRSLGKPGRLSEFFADQIRLAQATPVENESALRDIKLRARAKFRRHISPGLKNHEGVEVPDERSTSSGTKRRMLPSSHGDRPPLPVSR